MHATGDQLRPCPQDINGLGKTCWGTLPGKNQRMAVLKVRIFTPSFTMFFWQTGNWTQNLVFHTDGRATYRFFEQYFIYVHPSSQNFCPLAPEVLEWWRAGNALKVKPTDRAIWCRHIVAGCEWSGWWLATRNLPRFRSWRSKGRWKQPLVRFCSEMYRSDYLVLKTSLEIPPGMITDNQILSLFMRPVFFFSVLSLGNVGVNASGQRLTHRSFYFPGTASWWTCGITKSLVIFKMPVFPFDLEHVFSIERPCWNGAMLTIVANLGKLQQIVTFDPLLRRNYRLGSQETPVCDLKVASAAALREFEDEPLKKVERG